MMIVVRAYEGAERMADRLLHPHQLSLVPRTELTGGILHHIPTTGPPVHSRFRRLNSQQLAAAKSAFNEMESMGICAKASSSWASLLHMVTMQDRSWMICGDYQCLASLTPRTTSAMRAYSPSLAS